MIYTEITDTLFEVATLLAKRENADKALLALEQAILLTEITIDNAASEGKPTKELQALQERLLELQREVHNYATS